MSTLADALSPLTLESRFRDVLYGRRAVRAFKPARVDDKRIESLLDAAVHAPTARHQEPWQFVIVQDRAMLRRISDRAKELALKSVRQQGNLLKPPGAAGEGIPTPMADPNFNIFYDAGTLVVICGELEQEPVAADNRFEHSFVVADCWLAAENFMLAAHADGLGTCCIGFAVQVLNDPAIKKELGIPAAVEAIAPVIVGAPSGGTRLVPRKPPMILRWIR